MLLFIATLRVLYILSLFVATLRIFHVHRPFMLYAYEIIPINSKYFRLIYDENVSLVYSKSWHGSMRVQVYKLKPI